MMNPVQQAMVGEIMLTKTLCPTHMSNALPVTHDFVRWFPFLPEQQHFDFQAYEMSSGTSWHQRISRHIRGGENVYRSVLVQSFWLKYVRAKMLQVGDVVQFNYCELDGVPSILIRAWRSINGDNTSLVEL